MKGGFWGATLASLSHALTQLSRIHVPEQASQSCHLTSWISRRDKDPTPPITQELLF